MPDRTYLDIVDEAVRNNETGQLFIQYGGPYTMTLSAEKVQLVEHDGEGSCELIVIDEDLEILQGSK